MQDAKKFAEAKCYCNEEIPREFLKENYETKWSELQIIHAGLVSRIPQSQKVRKFDCCKCGKGFIIDDLRVMMCDHKYCAECLKELMKNSINKVKKKLVCTKCPTDLDGEVLSDVDRDLYERYLFVLAKND